VRHNNEEEATAATTYALHTHTHTHTRRIDANVCTYARLYPSFGLYYVINLRFEARTRRHTHGTRPEEDVSVMRHILKHRL
jgi:hypothetical protein